MNESKGHPVDYDTFATSAPREPREHTFVVPTQPSLVVQQPAAGAAGAAGETTMLLCRLVAYCCGAVLACLGHAADSGPADVSILSDANNQFPMDGTLNGLQVNIKH